MASIAESSVRARLSRIAAVIRRVIGVPDYERYLAHLARHHPGDVPMTRAAFTQDELARRHTRPGNRCC